MRIFSEISLGGCCVIFGACFCEKHYTMATVHLLLSMAASAGEKYSIPRSILVGSRLPTSVAQSPKLGEVKLILAL